MRLCGGCIFGYGGALLALLSVIIINLRYPLSPFYLAVLGLILIIPFVIQALISFPSALYRRISRFLAGAGGVLLIITPFIVDSWSVWGILIVVELVFLFSLVSYARKNGIERKCLHCLFKGDYSRCTGFREVRNKLMGAGIDPDAVMKKKKLR